MFNSSSLGELISESRNKTPRLQMYHICVLYIMVLALMFINYRMIIKEELVKKQAFRDNFSFYCPQPNGKYGFYANIGNAELRGDFIVTSDNLASANIKDCNQLAEGD